MTASEESETTIREGVKVFGAHNGGVIVLAEGGKGRGGRNGGEGKGAEVLHTFATHT